MLLALLAGCLLFATPPPRCPDCDGFSCDAAGVCNTTCIVDDNCAGGHVCNDERVCVPPCVDADCPDGRVCDTYAAECRTHCIVDSECQAGLVCEDDECEPPCEDEDCPGGYACHSYYNRCIDDCNLDSDCREGWHCCDYGEPGCDDGECTRG